MYKILYSFPHAYLGLLFNAQHDPSQGTSPTLIFKIKILPPENLVSVQKKSQKYSTQPRKQDINRIPIRTVIIKKK